MLKRSTLDEAKGKWRGILISKGIADIHLTGKHGKCPICNEGKDRFRFDDKDGKGTFYCSHCGAGTGIDMLMKIYGWSFKEACIEVDSVISSVVATEAKAEKTKEEKVLAIKKILSHCVPVKKGDPVWLYLNRRTGIIDVPSDIRLHKNHYHSSGTYHPTMVSIMRGVDGRGVSLHRTYLTKEGEKANVEPVKKFCEGLPINGSSIRLSIVQEHIGIAEGIETALSAGWVFDLPVWAATNATLLAQWNPPDGIKHVTVFGDNDSSFTGQAAAYTLAKRLVTKGITVDLKFPREVDHDWCDEGIESLPS